MATDSTEAPVAQTQAQPSTAPSTSASTSARHDDDDDGENITLTREQLNKRLERATRSYLRKEVGVESADELKARLARVAELETREAEAKRAQMTELERLQSDLRAAQTAREAAEAAAEQARVDLHLTRVFAKHGVRNSDYATWRIMDKLGTLPETEELDEEAYLRELLSDPRERIALGVEGLPEAPAPRTVAVAPTTTTPAGSAPKPPPPNPAVVPKSAYDLSPQEWARRKAEMGIP